MFAGREPSGRKLILPSQLFLPGPAGSSTPRCAGGLGLLKGTEEATRWNEVLQLPRAGGLVRWEGAEQGPAPVPLLPGDSEHFPAGL